MNSKTSNEPSARSPFAGCAILIAALLVMVFLVVFSTMALFRQFNEIAKFTAEKPQPVAVTPVVDQESALNALAERLENFRQQLDGDTTASIALTPEEMNLAIAAYEPFKELRGTFRILEVEGDVLRIAISFPLNGKPRLTREGEEGWMTSDSRYLNAMMIARPGLLKQEVILQIDDIKVPDKQVPVEFIGQMSPYRITERYLQHPVIGPVMAKLTKVGIEDGKVVLTRVPGEMPADTISDEQVNAAGKNMFVILGIVACVFLLFAGTVVFIGLRAKAKRE